jgi:hypothetical protein
LPQDQHWDITLAALILCETTHASACSAMCRFSNILLQHNYYTFMSVLRYIEILYFSPYECLANLDVLGLRLMCPSPSLTRNALGVSIFLA